MVRIWSIALLAAFAFNPVPTGSATVVTSHWTQNGEVALAAGDADAAKGARPETLTILTYNVQDLPLLIAGDRTSSLDRIAQRLRAMAARGEGADIVVVQEGFSDESVDMLRKAGYRHIVTGPGADVPRPRPTQPLSKAFLSEISMLAGEGVDPGASSGLIIASRYPIVSAIATPFPQNVCAGTDCLANKGMLTVRIALPGVAEPLEVTTSHLNAARRSGTAPAHHLYAYRQQVVAMEAFIQRQARPGAARIVVGDFNLGSSDQRLASFQAMINRLGLRPITAMGKHKDMPHCEQVGPCRGALPISPNVPLIDSLDWQIVADGRSLALAPLVRRVPFGREADGTMLSDHIGYSVTYRLTRRESGR